MKPSMVIGIAAIVAFVGAAHVATFAAVRDYFHWQEDAMAWVGIVLISIIDLCLLYFLLRAVGA